jgi:hypothetical protein
MRGKVSKCVPPRLNPSLTCRLDDDKQMTRQDFFRLTSILSRAYYRMQNFHAGSNPSTTNRFQVADLKIKTVLAFS